MTSQLLQRLVGLACAVAFQTSICATASAYSNPITVPNELPIDGVGDPFVLKHNGTFYLYSSQLQAPGFQYWTSTNLVDWSYGGIASSDPLVKDGYAPEVVYWNGTFYLYTSPGGGGHYVLTSTSPGGPFTHVTNNLGRSIDGDVFIDDDGSWFFFNAGGDGLHGSRMLSPTSLGVDTLLSGGQISGQWTEGPTVFKRNGVYHLTNTGNHVLSPGYRVNAATATAGPLGPYATSHLSPILLSTEGPHIGLGHNSVLIGPDLDTYYVVYHSLNGVIDGHPARKLNVDAIGWNGDQLVVYGPTTWAMQTPDAPSFADRFQRASLGAGYSNLAGGTWGIESGFLTQRTKGNTAFFVEYENTLLTASDYTAEYHVQEVSRGNFTPKCGAVFGLVDSQNYGYALLNGVTNQLQTNLYVNGKWGTEVSSPLPAGFDSTQLHTIRIEKSGTTYRFFVDKLLQETKTHAGLGAGYVGYLSQDDAANFGYLAVSNRVEGSGIFDFYKPIPGVIQAVHYNTGGEGIGYHDTSVGNDGGKYIRADNVDIRDNAEGGEAIGWNETGEWHAYNVNVEAAGTYDLGLRYATLAPAAQVKVWLDASDVTGAVTLPSTGGPDSWQTFDISGLRLSAGKHVLKVETLIGAFDFSTLTFFRADDSGIDTGDEFDGSFSKEWGFAGGNWSIVDGTANIDDTGKRTLGESGWTDYTVECDLRGETGLNSGILLRVQNPAQGGAGDDPSLGSDFYQGYLAGISTTQVFLGKQNYDYASLATAPGTYALNAWHHLKVVVSRNNLKVYVDDMDEPKLDYTDDAAPFIHGKVGLRAHHAKTSFDHLKISHAAPIPADAGVDSGPGPTDASVNDGSTPGPGIDASIPDASTAPRDAGTGDASTPPSGAAQSSSSSCGCDAAGGHASGMFGLALLGLAALARRRAVPGASQNSRS